MSQGSSGPRSPPDVTATTLKLSPSRMTTGLPESAPAHGPALNSLSPEQRETVGSFFPFRYSGSVVCANVSRDGERIVTASEDGTARIWDARNRGAEGSC